MKDKANELRDLWALSPSGSLTGHELLTLVQKDAHRQNLVTVLYIFLALVCVPLMALFVFLAVVAPLNTLQQIGSVCSAASCALLAFYILQNGRAGIALDPEQNLAAYTQATVHRCNHQIRFFKAIKYRYVLPLSVGTLISKAGSLMYRAKPGALRRIDIADVALSILSIGVLWAMYHFLVPWLTRKQRDKLVSMMGEKDQNEQSMDGTLPECG